MKTSAQYRPRLRRGAAALGAILPVLAFAAAGPAAAFGGIPSSGACTDFDANPQDFARHRDADITYRLTNNFKARYPDDFSQYLVQDAAELWEFYIGGVSPWNADIADRFSYYRKDPNEIVYELKNVMTHEFGHALGMQHSDACWYNNNPNTNMPYNLNFRTSGGNFTATATLGPETMNEYPTTASPGAKNGPPVDGYFRTPGRDDLEFMGAAYPFLSFDLVQTNSNSARISIDSTDIGSSGGQTSYPGGFTNIDPNDAAQGRFMDGVNIWVGNNIGIKSRDEGWFIENFTGFNIVQITLRVDGTSTRRAIAEVAPPFFTNFGAGLTSSAEQLIFDWTTPFTGPWPPMGSGWLELELDVHDWTLAEALMWANSNQAFPLALPFYQPFTPWEFATPNSPPLGAMAQFTIDPGLQPEATPAPDNIELIPPASGLTPGIVRGFKAFLPPDDGVEIESFQLLPIDFAEAELFFRMPPEQRNRQLMQAFEDRRAGARDLLGSSIPLSPDIAGFVLDRAYRNIVRQGSAHLDPPLFSRRIDVDLPDAKTYAVKMVVRNENARVTSIALPEHTTYLGTELARCDFAEDPAQCCPNEIRNRVRIAGKPAVKLDETACLIGKRGGDTVNVEGKTPHFVSLGGGGDSVRVFQSGSLVLLGDGADTFEAVGRSAATVRAGRGGDTVRGSPLDDHIDAGDGPDTVYTFAGNDTLFLGEGADRADSGPGDDTIYPGSGHDTVKAGAGDDTVIYVDACELRGGASLDGGPGSDRLVLPGTEDEARQAGVQFSGFETIVENAARASVFPACEQ